MKQNFLYIALVFFLAAGAGIFVRQNIGQKSVEEELAPRDEPRSVAPAQWERQVSTAGGVEVSAAPGDLSENASSLDFEISLDTHSVELNYDMVAGAALADETGKEYKPFLWEGAEPGGHHRSGILKFNRISPHPKNVTLILRGIGGVPETRFTWTISGAAQEAITVKAFFNNSKMDPEFSCNKVFAVERVIPKTQATARAALEELFNGLTEEEKSQGFFTSIPMGVEIQGLRIENSVAYADFNEALQFQVGGSCRVSAIRSQITETLKQFPTVQQVIIFINGRTEDILQP